MLSAGFDGSNLKFNTSPLPGLKEMAANATSKGLGKKGASQSLRILGGLARFAGPIAAAATYRYVGPDKEQLKLIPPDNGETSFRKWNEARDYWIHDFPLMAKPETKKVEEEPDDDIVINPDADKQSLTIVKDTLRGSDASPEPEDLSEAQPSDSDEGSPRMSLEAAKKMISAAIANGKIIAAAIHARGGNYEKALELLKEVEAYFERKGVDNLTPRERADYFNTLVNLTALQKLRGDWESLIDYSIKGESILTGISEIPQGVQKRVHQMQQLRAEAYLQLEQYTEAIEVLANLRNATKYLEKRFKLGIKLAATLIKAGNPESARDLLEQIEEELGYDDEATSEEKRVVYALQGRCLAAAN